LFEQNGFEVFAYPVDLTGQSTEKITVINFLPNADALARASLTLRELLGRFYYKLKHVFFFSPTINE
jgi:uncharacterized SAM-binding protein YcdF (DUF218 family)